MTSTLKDRSAVADELGAGAPLCSLLVVTSDPATEMHNWDAISARLDASERGGVMVLRTLVDMLWSAPRLRTAATVLVLAVTVVGGWRLLGTPPAMQEPSADLRLASGDAFTGVFTPKLGADSELRRVSLSDGSSIAALEAGTRLEPLAVSATDVVLHLVEGSVSIHVKKGGPRRWRVEAGAMNIEVVGTTFEVSRRQERSRVSVSEGAVLVRGASLPDGIRRVAAGEHVEVLTRAPEPVAPPSVDVEGDRTAPPRERPTPKSVHREIQPAAGELMAHFDKARAEGKWDAAQLSLESLLRRFPSAPEAGLAAYQLAMVKQKRGAPIGEINAAFVDALARANAESLRQECYWRLVQVAEAGGDRASAQRWVEASLREFPGGRYAAQLRSRASLRGME